MKKKILNLLLGVFLVCGVRGQETIKFNKNPYTNENHFIIKLEKKGKTNSKKFFDTKEKVFKYGYKKPVVTVDDFRSITIHEKGKLFDLILNLDADGVVELDVSTTKYIEREHAFVFNDTIYQTKQFSSPSYDGQFLIENVSKEQKNKIVEFYKNLPNYELQKSFYYAIKDGEYKKIDSLLNAGAVLSEINTSIGHNKVNGVFYDIISRRNSKYTKYRTMTDYLLQKGFVPKAKTFEQAIVYDDVVFMKKYFAKINNKEEKRKLLKRELSRLFSSGSVAMMQEYERLGFDFTTEKYSGKNMLLYAVINGNANAVSFMLEKGISYNELSLLTYSLVYNSIYVTDALLRKGLNLNALFDDNDNIAQELILVEYSHDYSLGDTCLDKIPFMIERGFNPTTIGSKGKTLLHTLANKSDKFLDYILKASSKDIEFKRVQKITDLVNQIKNKEANLISIKDVNGFTAYDYALAKVNEMNEEIKEREKEFERKIYINREAVKSYLAAFKN